MFVAFASGQVLIFLVCDLILIYIFLHEIYKFSYGQQSPLKFRIRIKKKRLEQKKISYKSVFLRENFCFTLKKIVCACLLLPTFFCIFRNHKNVQNKV